MKNKCGCTVLGALREQRGFHHARGCTLWAVDCSRCHLNEVAFEAGEFTGLCVTCAENDYLGIKAERDMLASFVGRVSESANTHQLAALDAIRWLKIERQEESLYDRWKRLAGAVEGVANSLDIVCASRTLPKKMYAPLAGVRDILRAELRRGQP